jgi:SPP1 family predicted phage head-tail adaptor
VQAGKLNSLINIEHQVAGASDGIGNTYKTWRILYRSVPAEMITFSAREQWVGEAPQSQATHRVNLRYLAGVQSTMRVSFNGRIFNIVGLANDESKRTSTQLDVKEDFAPDIPAVEVSIQTQHGKASIVLHHAVHTITGVANIQAAP